MKVKIGIVGVGATVGIAHFHTLGYLKDERAEVAAVFDVNPAYAKRYIEEHKVNAKVCETYEELLQLVDAVDICTPNFAHTDYVVQAAKAGKAILCEKPLATTIEDCEKAAAAVKEAGVFNMLGFVYRFWGHAAAIKNIYDKNFSRIYTVTCSFGGDRLSNPNIPVEWRMDKQLAGMGALGDFGSHFLDFINYTCGINIQKAFSARSTFIPERAPGVKGKTIVETEDSAAFIGVGEKGELISMMLSRVGLEPMNMIISGDGGLIYANYKNDYIEYVSKKIGEGYPNMKPEKIELGEQNFQNGFDNEMKAFISGVLGEDVDICTIEKALRVEKILAAAEQADECGAAKEV